MQAIARSIIDRHADLIETWKTAVRLMENGQMRTSVSRNGKVVDTTIETITDFKTYIAELEAIDSDIRSDKFG